LISFRGPNIQGLAPREASDRLQIFQTRFDELWRKYTTYSGGEELFGLTVTGTAMIVLYLPLRLNNLNLLRETI